MIAAMLLMLVAGIGLAQAVSDPHAVTLRWLRLGGIIAVSLGGIALVVIIASLLQDDRFVRARMVDAAILVVIIVLPFIVQLLTVQTGERHVQRVAAGVGYVLFGGLAWAAISAIGGQERATDLRLLPVAYLSGGLLGGYLMTMLLGHAYLTAGAEMTQAPFRRLVATLGILLALRCVFSLLFGLVPWLGEPRDGASVWPIVMMAARYVVGILAAGVFTWMTWDCVKRRANQSATGILYVTTVLVIIGEWSALSLFASTGLAF